MIFLFPNDCATSRPRIEIVQFFVRLVSNQTSLITSRLPKIKFYFANKTPLSGVLLLDCAMSG
jgi:hypothetical protein